MSSFKDRMRKRKEAAASATPRPPAAKPLEEAPRAEVSDEQPTTQFVVTKRTEEQPTREIPAEDAAKLAAAEKAVAEEAQPEAAALEHEESADDLVEEARPAISAKLPPLPAHGVEEESKQPADPEALLAMLGEMLKPITEGLAALEGRVDKIRTAVFGKDMEATVQDFEGKSLVDVFSGELADLATIEDVEEMVANAAPVQASVDLSGIEADVAQLKQTVYRIAGDGTVLDMLAEPRLDAEDNQVLDNDGNPVYECALYTLGNHATVEDQFGKNGELLPVYVKQARLVIASNLVAKMLKTELTDKDMADIQEAAGECPDISRQILETLAADPVHMTDVMARVEGSSFEDLDEPDRKQLKEEIEKYLPTMLERAKFFAKNLPWDALERRLKEQKGQGETGGDA